MVETSINCTRHLGFEIKIGYIKYISHIPSVWFVFGSHIENWLCVEIDHYNIANFATVLHLTYKQKMDHILKSTIFLLP